MIRFEYLSKGLNALARAHQMNSMAGHLGAAVVAGYFVGEQRPDLSEEVSKGLEGDLDRVMQGESVFGKKMSRNAKITDNELFAAFPKEKPDEGLVEMLVEALGRNVGQARQSGHNVIFASIAIRALKDHPDYATPSVVEGIRKLITKFDGEHPGSGFYGKAKGRIYGHKVKLPDNDGTPPYQDLEGMVHAVLDEVLALDPQVHRQGYGSLVHVINHAAAIVDLARYGCGHLVPQAIASHRHHLRLYRNLPNLVEELGPMKVSEFTPHEGAYWTSGEIPYDRALLTHRAKTMFGFDELASAVEAPAKEKQAYLNLRYLM